jgi:hypothetical protein
LGLEVISSLLGLGVISSLFGLEVISSLFGLGGYFFFVLSRLSMQMSSVTLQYNTTHQDREITSNPKPGNYNSLPKQRRNNIQPKQ